MSQAHISDTTTLLTPSRRYTKSGIGGAGNIRLSSSSLTVPSAPRIIPTPSKGSFLTGIGGAGNSRSYEERASIPVEEELARRSARKQSVAGSWHHGIGGAGNRSSYSYGESETSSSVESGSFFTSAMAMQSGADRVKVRVASYFGGSKRNSMADEKDDLSVDGRESWSKEN